MSRSPSVKWAQRQDKVFLTVELPDAKDVKLNLEPEGKFSFSAVTGPDNTPYKVEFDLFDKVDLSESKSNTGPRNIFYIIKKAEEKWWSRLLKQEGKAPSYLKVDWDKWVDEDEQDEKPEPGMDFGEGFDFSNLNMGGAGGFDGDFGAGGAEDDEDDDSDTEEDIAKDTEAVAASSNAAEEHEPKAA
ncbi:unnamed protein product [Cuscuta campestris]|uniref:Co-chaperone protein p23 n=2 Tax=Cuscuta sect. Cleistogrammica TaxID=1824901 RepID=A0A484M9K9_9ASTE|nr:unnamed protein product [Cuscuta campestris]